MEIILKQDVPGLGYTNDLIVVKNGFARNYLIPQGIAVNATDSNKKVRAEDLKQKAFKEEKIKKEAEVLAKAIDGITVKIGAKAGTSGKIFGSVNTLQLAEAIKVQFKYDIDRKKIEIKDAVKEVGTYIAKVNLHKEVKVEINFEVIAE
jgi:large subunit ribosomal protein L9